MDSSASRRPAESSATVIISLKIHKGREDDYRRWQERVNAVAHAFEGFEETEVQPPGPVDQDVWVVIYRFSDVARLTAWLDSPARGELLDEGRSLFDGPAKQEVLAGEAPRRDVITAVISHEVRPGREQDFVRWQEKARNAQERFPGFMGFELFRPVPGIQENWVAIFRFDTREHLNAWLESETRRKLLEEGRRYFAEYELRKIDSAFSGWFRFGGESETGLPPNWKQAMCVLLALYPTVMILTLTAGKVFEMARIPGYAAMFLSNVLSVSILTWLMMPLVNRVLAFWLAPGVALPRQAAGVAVVLLCYLLSVVVFGLIAG
ncbi:antibiotic biosynthesis monooxygenase [Actinoallomurus sp. CA-150999]|uniref:antibiotic biosynthesis monooxygenase n=1 Tax=Actinoallomurus sp. CA-150999 TaxID=3239887 RepID=UPI003D8FC47C